jgi:hypothetical protein
MSARHLAAAALLAAALLPAAFAQDMGDEIVVTASRYTDLDEDARADAPPYVMLRRRADFLITSVQVVCDTRDPAQREDELRKTLAGMMVAAQADAGIDLGLGEETLGELTDDAFDDLIKPGDRPDSSYAVVVVKTPIQPTDTFDQAAERVRSFISESAPFGRTEIKRFERWDLTIVGPERSRNDLIARIAANAREVSAQFGPNYRVSISGLQGPIQWRQTAPLDLSLYIPYTLDISSPSQAAP